MSIELLGDSNVAFIHKELLVLESDYYAVKNFRQGTQGRWGDGNKRSFEYQQPDSE